MEGRNCPPGKAHQENKWRKPWERPCWERDSSTRMVRHATCVLLEVRQSLNAGKRKKKEFKQNRLNINAVVDTVIRHGDIKPASGHCCHCHHQGHGDIRRGDINAVLFAKEHSVQSNQIKGNQRNCSKGGCMCYSAKVSHPSLDDRGVWVKTGF